MEVMVAWHLPEGTLLMQTQGRRPCAGGVEREADWQAVWRVAVHRAITAALWRQRQRPCRGSVVECQPPPRVRCVQSRAGFTGFRGALV